MADHTIAVIDDDAEVLNSFRYWLEFEGHKVAAYPSAFAFLADVDAAPVCMIVDQHMPGMTGLELAEHLRVTRRHIPFLLLTGALSPSIVTAAKVIGVAGVLDKPPDGRVIRAFIAEHE